MNSKTNSVTLVEFIRHVENHLVVADAEMQVLQNTAWRQFEKNYNTFVEHCDLTEGIARLNNLKVSEMAVTFYVTPLRRGFIGRVWHWFCSFFGKPVPIANGPQLMLTSPEELSRGTCFEITVTFRRDEKGRFKGNIDRTDMPSAQILMKSI